MDTPLDSDMKAYTHAVESLIREPVQGPSGMYHVKNGIIHHGYSSVAIKGFSVSDDYWNIFH